MGILEEGPDDPKEKFEELCRSLNMDRDAQEEAWDAFERISTNYTLEGDSLHWLACALYVACRNTVTQTVGSGEVEGNFVSLTRLLRCTNLSLLEFFKKIRKWSNMANLPQELREKVDKLERYFAVSSVIFQKFRPIFLDIFCNPADEKPKPPRSRKQKRLPCSLNELFQYTWSMFVQVKGNFRAIGDDLVNSYHLLLCCVDWVYVNALLSNRKDLINPNFSGLPEGFESKEYKPPVEVPCLLKELCSKHDGVLVEAKGIKEHWWKPHIRKLFDKKILKGRQENLTGILEIGCFEANTKGVAAKYEEHLLNFGDFDERIFLNPDADHEIGTPAKSGAYNPGDLQEQMSQKFSYRHSLFETTRLAPSTPLTGQKYLANKSETFSTPVTTATQSVHRLQALLCGRKVGPSEELTDIFKKCSSDPSEAIAERLLEMGEIFCHKYSSPSEDVPPQLDFAKKRLQFAESLYYKVMENIMMKEQRRLQSKDPKNCDLSSVMSQDIFHQTLITCCMEVVLFSYNSQRMFPWVIDIFNVDAFYFYKVIELVIRAEDGLSRDVVKHLSWIEESVLESGAWRAESRLWVVINDWLKEVGQIPSVEDVHFPGQIEKEGVTVGSPPLSFSSPIQHPALRRLAGEQQTSLIKQDILQSPTGPSAVDFMSPMPGSAKRRLFETPSQSASSSIVSSPLTTPVKAPSVQILSSHQIVTTFQLAETSDGKKILVPYQCITPIKPTLPRELNILGEKIPDKTIEEKEKEKPKRTGSFALFLRKLYHLASVRLQDMCEKLDIDSELHRQIWTVFEFVLMVHIDLLKDRHLDQLIMCSIYMMGKVTRKERSFTDIMRCYRLQPQAQSHVYRSILMSKTERRPSTDSNKSDTSQKTKESNSTSDTCMAGVCMNDPPTPTRMAGTQSVFEYADREEKRGDLIKFYNEIFVVRIKDFSMKFATEDTTQTEVPILSPLPLSRCQAQSPRRISSNHSVFVSQHGSRDNALTPTTNMLYCFNRSPATDLRAINKMLRMNEKGQQASKRLLEMPEPSEAGAAKRICITNSPMFQKRLEMLVSERKATNNGVDS